MATYDADLQAAVDATSVAKDAGLVSGDDLVGFLREQLHERGVETSDEGWLRHAVAGIEGDPNYMIDREPDDYDPPERQAPRGPDA